MSDLIDRHEAIRTIASYNGVVDKSVAKRLLLQMPSAEPEIIRCKDCRHGVDYYHEGDCYCSNPKYGLMYFGGSWEFYCADAERGNAE